MGELRALTPADIDFETNTLSITKSYQRIKGEDVITKPKTKKSIRKVVMPDTVAKEMRDFLDSIYGLEQEDRIFPISKSYLHHEMDRGVKESGVKRIRIHDDRVIIGASQKKPSKIKGLQMILSCYFLQ